MERRSWLLLIHQIPKEPAYLRVKIGRRIARVGALGLKGSVYVLPRTDATAEDFNWIRKEILEGGGEATVAEAQLVQGLSDDELVARFQKAKDAEYAEPLVTARALRKRIDRARSVSPETAAAFEAEIAKLDARARDIAAHDFFAAREGERLVTLLAELRSRLHQAPRPAPLMKLGGTGYTWVTRTGIHVDRIASAWLIRRFIDSDAVFKWVRAKGYEPLQGELRFDMFEAEFSHVGDQCTFETLVSRFRLRAPGLEALAEIVHDIDLKESRFGRPETAGVAATILGICRMHADDEGRLAQGSALFEALLARFVMEKSR